MTIGDGLFQYGGAPVVSMPTMAMYAGSQGGILFVDGTNGADGNSGTSPKKALATIQKAVDLSVLGGVIYVFPKKFVAGATDATVYAETVIVPNALANLSIIGVGSGRTQGGLPEMKIGAGTTAMIDVRAPGFHIENMTINGASSTGGGIKLTDTATTASVALGFSAYNCFFKNCKCHATYGASGGAIYQTTGGCWQLHVKGCRFYKNTGGIVSTSTSLDIPQDWVIEDCTFGSAAATDVDVDIFTGADGVTGLTIRNCEFQTVDVPSKSSGNVGRYIKLATGTAGIISGCKFACLVNPAATEVTFGAAGTAAIIPTTVRIVGCTGETSSTTEQNIVYRT